MEVKESVSEKKNESGNDDDDDDDDEANVNANANANANENDDERSEVTNDVAVQNEKMKKKKEGRLKERIVRVKKEEGQEK